MIVTFDRDINGLHCHCPVSGPLSTSYGDEVGRTDVNDVVASKGLGVGLVGVGDERSDATPGREDVATSHLNIWVEVVLHLLQDEHNLVLGGSRVVRHLAGEVSRARDRVLLPRQEKDDAAVAGRWIEQTHLVWAVGKIVFWLN